MSKAILVMEMPKCCGDCVFSNPDGDYCPFLGEVTFSEYEVCKKANCPLRELPERRPERILKTLGKSVKTTKFEHSDLNIGWNACLDAIESRMIGYIIAIGTEEECREARERQKPKKPIRIDKCTCPSCGTYNETVQKRRNTVPEDTVYCWHCGQALEVRSQRIEGGEDKNGRTEKAQREILHE